MRKPVSLLVSLLSMLYPFLWWLFHRSGWPVWPLALAMAAAWAIRSVFSPSPAGTLGILFSGLFLFVAVAQIPALMLYYPLLVNGAMLCLFGGSLVFGTPLVERLARHKNPDLSRQGIVYTRRLTYLWCVFFLANGAVNGWLIYLGDLRWWALYSGAVSYVLIGTLLILEWSYRKWILKWPG